MKNKYHNVERKQTEPQKKKKILRNLKWPSKFTTPIVVTQEIQTYCGEKGMIWM